MLQLCDGGFDHGLCFGHDGFILGDQAGHRGAHAAQFQAVHPVKALEAGAFALVVGGAITRPAEITARFTGAINAAKK